MSNDDRSGSNPSRGQSRDGPGTSIFGIDRQRAHELVETARENDRASRLVDMTLVTLILLNVAAFVAETVPDIQARYGGLLKSFEIISVAIFTLEYATRLWTCVEMPFLARMEPMTARLRFAMRPYLIIDLVAILPFFLGAFLPINLRILRVLRVFRILKLARYSPAMHSLIRVLHNQRRTLVGTLLLLLTVLLFVSTAAYYAERTAQPDKFGSIPNAAWWAIATLTTVGYGDITPVTGIGKLIGAMAMILGIAVLALPIAIIATGFASEAGNRDFVITLSHLARIPVLAGLDTQDLPGVMRVLYAQRIEPYREIISPDDPAESIFFVVSGEVRLVTEAGETLFQPGDSFGELAMLEGRNHTNPYRTTRPTRVLRLAHDDFQFLVETHPKVARQLSTLAVARREARKQGLVDPTLASTLRVGA